MRVELSNIADFHRLAVPAYVELSRSPGIGRPRLEIVLAPGTYAGSGLTLGEPMTGQAIDVIVRAADPKQPPLLTDMSLSLWGREVRLQNLVFEANSRELPLVHASVQASLDISDCAFVANQTSERAGGRMLEISVGKVTPPTTTTATIRGSWFIRNRAPEQSTLVAFDARPPLSFARIQFEDVAFIENAADCCIVAGLSDLLELSRCVGYAPAGPDPKRLFAAVSFLHTHVELSHSLFAGFEPETLVSRWSASHPEPRDFQPVAMRASEVVEQPPALSDSVVEGWVEAAKRGVSPGAFGRRLLTADR